MNQISIGVESWDRDERLALRVLGCAAFAVLTALAAFVRIPLPFTPVPMSLQTFMVALAGGILGARWGTASMGLYLFLGIVGVDVFAAAPGGIRIFLAPTAGYLLGFLIAAGLVGYVREASKNRWVLLAALVGSQVIILGCGVIGLIFNAGMYFSEAIVKGVLPFLTGDMLKTAASFFVLLSYDHFRKVTNL